MRLLDGVLGGVAGASVATLVIGYIDNHGGILGGFPSFRQVVWESRSNLGLELVRTPLTARTANQPLSPKLWLSIIPF